MPNILKEGLKYDKGKLRFDLIPVRPLEKVAHVYTIGAEKYNDRNWELGMKFGRIFAAMMRHAWAWWRGEKNDPKDGQHHLASVAWCAFSLMELEETKPEFDDRVEAIEIFYIPEKLVTRFRLNKITAKKFRKELEEILPLSKSISTLSKRVSKR